MHPDLWNKTSLWDPLGIGRVRVDSLASQETSLDDEFVEENYGAPINTVSMLSMYAVTAGTQSLEWVSI